MNIALSLKARVSVSAERAWFAAGLATIVLAGAVALVQPLSLLFRIVPRSYNEGWNAFWADAAATGHALYVPPDSLIANNYPPISFHLIGFFGKLLGDNIIAGRLVSLVSLLVVIVAAYVWLRAAGSARQIALAGATVLFATFAHYGHGYVAMNDPQVLGHAFMLSAVVLMWRLEFSRAAVIVGAGLMLLGGFTKHLLIPVPVAMTLWLAVYQRQRVLLWLACFAIGLPLGFWLTTNSYPLFVEALLAPRVYLVHQAFSATTHAVLRLLPLLVVGVIPLVYGLRNAPNTVLAPRMVFVLIYLALSLIVGAIAGGGEGVTRNAFFDLLIASSLLAALGLEWMWEHWREPRFLRRLSAAPAAVVVLAAGVILYSLASLPRTIRAVQGADALERDTRATIEMIGRLGRGHAGCETLALCYWAHSPFTIDFFNYGQKIQTGALSVDSCTEALRRGQFPVLQVELESDDSARHRLGACAPAIQRYYTEVSRTSAGALLVPTQPVARL